MVHEDSTPTSTPNQNFQMKHYVLLILNSVCLSTIAHTTLIHKNFAETVCNIDKCSLSEALDKSVPGAWVGQVWFSFQPTHKHLHTGSLHIPLAVSLYCPDSMNSKAKCYGHMLPLWGHSFNDSTVCVYAHVHSSLFRKRGGSRGCRPPPLLVVSVHVLRAKRLGSSLSPVLLQHRFLTWPDYSE